VSRLELIAVSIASQSGMLNNQLFEMHTCLDVELFDHNGTYGTFSFSFSISVHSYQAIKHFDKSHLLPQS
jgi:hypothetical protein